LLARVNCYGDLSIDRNIDVRVCCAAWERPDTGLLFPGQQPASVSTAAKSKIVSFKRFMAKAPIENVEPLGHTSMAPT
jgi:hypothetical protein